MKMHLIRDGLIMLRTEGVNALCSKEGDRT